ncbi:MAG: aminotransferase class V-fold PLP-dependent enzyme, partial [Pseudomonadota bacterium]
NGEEISIHGKGNGPIDAYVNALKQHSGVDISVMDYSEHATGEGANATAIARFNSVAAPATEHESVDAAIAVDISKHDNTFRVDASGRIDVAAVEALYRGDYPTLGCISPASGETGVIEDVAALIPRLRATYETARQSFPARDAAGNPAVWSAPIYFHCDATQAVSRGAYDHLGVGADFAALSAHKLGGPKGVGALLVPPDLDPVPLVPGGGQEDGWRSGTENVIGIAGFGAAAEAARQDLEARVWEPVARLRNILEETLAAAAPETIFVGKGNPRLPNTSCFITPGWKGETQVMAMDLAGFAVSAGSACSSGKVGPSRVLAAMGFDETAARSALRVSMGPATTEAEVMAFAAAWTEAYRRWRARAA